MNPSRSIPRKEGRQNERRQTVRSELQLQADVHPPAGGVPADHLFQAGLQAAGASGQPPFQIKMTAVDALDLPLLGHAAILHKTAAETGHAEYHVCLPRKKDLRRRKEHPAMSAPGRSLQICKQFQQIKQINEARSACLWAGSLRVPDSSPRQATNVLQGLMARASIGHARVVCNRAARHRSLPAGPHDTGSSAARPYAGLRRSRPEPRGSPPNRRPRRSPRAPCPFWRPEDAPARP